MALKGYSSPNTAEQRLLSTTPVTPVTASLIAPPFQHLRRNQTSCSLLALCYRPCYVTPIYKHNQNMPETEQRWSGSIQQKVYSTFSLKKKKNLFPENLKLVFHAWSVPPPPQIKYLKTNFLIEKQFTGAFWSSLCCWRRTQIRGLKGASSIAWVLLQRVKWWLALCI